MIREADMKCEAEVAEVPAEEKEDPEERPSFRLVFSSAFWG